MPTTTDRNVDFQDGNTVPFTQYLRPFGHRSAQWIGAGSDGIDAEVVAKAREIVAAGFFLEMEELPTSVVSFTIGDDHGDYVFELCQNGPEVPAAVRRLIMAPSIADLRAMRASALEDSEAA